MRKRKKKYRLKKSVKFVLMVISVFLALHLFKGKETIKVNNSNDIPYTLITSKSETDNESIQKTFQQGMSEKDFMKILKQKENYISKTDTYQIIKYDFEKKLHYVEIEEYLKNINNLDIFNVEIIGKSVDERNIYGVEIGIGDKVIMLDANIHSGEVANTVILLKFISEIANSYYNKDENIINILKQIKLVIIPSINPDGYEVFNFGVNSLQNKNLFWYENKDSIEFSDIKSNANGIDLNRNFPTQNAGKIWTNKTLKYNTVTSLTTDVHYYFNGDTLGSEPETKAVMYFILKHYENTIAYINMHSQGRVIYATKPNLSPKFNLKTMSFAEKIANITGYQILDKEEEVGEGNDGSITDFMAELANGFLYSKKTGRLTSNRYIDNTCDYIYEYPVITLETILTYTDDVSVFKEEYYNSGIRKMLYELLEHYSELTM